MPVGLQRFRTGAWALVLPLNIAVVVVAIALIPTTADVLTWVALLLVPPGLRARARVGGARRAAVAGGPRGAAARARLGEPGHAAPARPRRRCSSSARPSPSAGCSPAAAPLTLLKVGVLAMAAIDAYLVFSGQLEAPNAVLVAAAPGLGLPQLQSASFGHAGLGYGDFFAAAVVGGILAAERAPQFVPGARSCSS